MASNDRPLMPGSSPEIATERRTVNPWVWVAGVVFVLAFLGAHKALESEGAKTESALQATTTSSNQEALDGLERFTNPDRSSKAVQESNPKSTSPSGSNGFLLAPDVLFARSSPAVVQVVIQDRQGRTAGTGSGFLVRSSGLIATNYHVIEKAHTAHVVLPDKTRVAVLGVAASDAGADVAIISLAHRIDAQPLEIAAGDLPVVGAKVYAIGNPLGLANTLSDGLVSGHRTIDRITEIQTTAPISPGSSGGPLLAADGRVVGVTTSTFKAGQNVNFAVPASHVVRLLRQWETTEGLIQFPLARKPDVSERIESADLAVRKGEFDEAIKQYDEAIRLDPASNDAYRGRAWAWSVKWEYAKAIRDFDAAIRLDPTDSEAYRGRGSAWRAQQKYDQAIKDYDAAIQLAPESSNA